MNKTHDQLIDLLKKHSRLTSGSGELLKNLTQELAYKNDPELIELLLTNEDIKKQFFTQIKEVLIFNHQKFIRFVTSKQFLPNSYTAFKNKVGLAVNGEYIDEKNDVVLVWPYKDCVLEGGMTKEDQSRNEFFYNETLASDQINQLLDPKVFKNIVRYIPSGKEKVDRFNRHPNGFISNNLIIKGNNLLVLRSLLEKYRSQVKLIYIDPPYNTGSDSFNYNDAFNHSTWLTFMKDRLEIAHKLLKSDGVLFCSINHIELGYLLVLLDEIFGKENKLPIITLIAGTTASYRSINDCPVNVSEYVLAYRKDITFSPNKVYRSSSYSEDYSHYIENFSEKPEAWRILLITDYIYEKEKVSNWREFKKKFGDNWKKTRFDMMEEFAFENKYRVVSLNTLQKPSQNIQKIIEFSYKNRNQVFSIPREGLEPIYCYNGRTLAFFESKFRDIDGDLLPSEILTNIWDDVSFLGIGPEGGVSLPNGKKPEYLIQTILELTTTKGDLVLDFHLGTGTTAAVAHKMGRQYIGIEQLDYEENDSVIRLKNVINGDKSGISKTVGWKGGGDFIYMELAEWNQVWICKIEAAVSSDELIQIWEEMNEKAFLSYKVDPNSINKNVSDFKHLSIEHQKKFLLECLDKNHLYINYSEIEDKDYGLKVEEILLNRDFYN